MILVEIKTKKTLDSNRMYKTGRKHYNSNRMTKALTLVETYTHKENFRF